MATRSEYQDLMTARGKKMKPGTQLHKMKRRIVLSAERSEVKVRLYQPAGAVTETWRIIREKDARQNDIIRLQRPNGALVMQNLQGKESP
ncbi:hypothetical protein AB9K36_02340 [Klebsiella michiganensis]